MKGLSSLAANSLAIGMKKTEEYGTMTEKEDGKDVKRGKKDRRECILYQFSHKFLNILFR
jgi:hypothetical protein